MSSLASRVEVVEELEPGLAGIDQARAWIQEKIDAGGRSDLVRRRAEQIVARVAPWDDERVVRELFNYFIGPNGFPYRRDPVNVQHIDAAPQWPWGGDCKKYAVQLGAYLEALGYPVEVVIVGQTAPAPGRAPRFHHVYLRALVNGQWMALDPTLHRPTHGIYAEAGDELPHAVERTYSMNGFAAANVMGDFFGDLFKSVGYALDPSREGSPLRAIGAGVLNLVAPGSGTAAVGALDAAAKARHDAAVAAAAAQASEPATLTQLQLPPDTKVETPAQAESGEGKTIADLAKELAKTKETGSSSLPAESTEKSDEKEKSGSGLSVGLVLGGVAATLAVGGAIFAAVKAGKPRKKK